MPNAAIIRCLQPRSPVAHLAEPFTRPPAKRPGGGSTDAPLARLAWPLGASVPDGPGLGITVDRAALKPFAI